MSDYAKGVSIEVVGTSNPTTARKPGMQAPVSWGTSSSSQIPSPIPEGVCVASRRRITAGYLQICCMEDGPPSPPERILTASTLFLATPGETRRYSNFEQKRGKRDAGKIFHLLARLLNGRLTEGSPM